MLTRDGVCEMGQLVLTHGGILRPCRMAYRTFGDPALPAVLVLGGISAGRDITTIDGRGWWPAFVGPGAAIDTDRFHVIGIDYLGGVGSASGAPGPGVSIDTQDQAQAVAHTLAQLGVFRLHGIVGSSYGGMVALKFAAVYGPRVRRLVVISAAHRTHPMATAWRCAQRRIVLMHAGSGRECESLALARSIAMTTYRSEREFSERFAVEPYRIGARFRFPVEDYLDHAGGIFARTATPATFVPLSESIDLHRVIPSAVKTPATLIAVDGDVLVPVWLMAELAAGIAAPVDACTVESRYGHDAFLKEPERIGPIVARGLGGRDG